MNYKLFRGFVNRKGEQCVVMGGSNGEGSGPDNNKADKVSGATEGNLAALNENGNLTDSGKKASDFAAAEHEHEEYMQKPENVSPGHIAFFGADGKLIDNGKHSNSFASVTHTHSISSIDGLQEIINSLTRQILDLKSSQVTWTTIERIVLSDSGAGNQNQYDGHGLMNLITYDSLAIGDTIRLVGVSNNAEEVGVVEGKTYGPNRVYVSIDLSALPRGMYDLQKAS